MRRRLAFAAVPVAIIGAVAVAVLTSSGSRPAAGDYAGRSSQGLPFKLTVAPDRRTLTVDVRWRCSGDGVRAYRRSGVKITGDGAFSWKGRFDDPVEGGDGDEERQRLRIDGRLDGDRRMTGTWRADLSYYNGESYAIDSRCTSGAVTFAVRGRRGAPGTDDAGNRVIALDTTPNKLAVRGGRAWVLGSDARGQALFAFDPATGRVVGRTPVRATVGNVIAAGAGAAWVLTFGDGPHNGLTRVDGRTGRATSVLLPPGPGPSSQSDPPEIYDMAVGAGGVWLHRGDRVLHVDPRSGSVVGTIRLSRAAPGPGGLPPCTMSSESLSDRQANLVSVGAGAVWVTSNCGPRRSAHGFLLRIDPRSDRVTRAIALRAGYTHIAVGAIGVWGATRYAPASPAVGAVPAQSILLPTLQRIGLRDGRPTRVTPLPAGGVSALGVSRDAVWASRFGADRSDAPAASLLRLNPAHGGASRALALEQPYDMAVGERGVWVLDGFARTLTRVRPG
jgi:hypothetical protein